MKARLFWMVLLLPGFLALRFHPSKHAVVNVEARNHGYGAALDWARNAANVDRPMLRFLAGLAWWLRPAHLRRLQPLTWDWPDLRDEVFRELLLRDDALTERVLDIYPAWLIDAPAQDDWPEITATWRLTTRHNFLALFPERQHLEQLGGELVKADLIGPCLLIDCPWLNKDQSRILKLWQTLPPKIASDGSDFSEEEDDREEGEEGGEGRKDKGLIQLSPSQLVMVNSLLAFTLNRDDALNQAMAFLLRLSTLTNLHRGWLRRVFGAYFVYDQRFYIVFDRISLRVKQCAELVHLDAPWQRGWWNRLSKRSYLLINHHDWKKALQVLDGPFERQLLFRFMWRPLVKWASVTQIELFLLQHLHSPLLPDCWSVERLGRDIDRVIKEEVIGRLLARLRYTNNVTLATNLTCLCWLDPQHTGLERPRLAALLQMVPIRMIPYGWIKFTLDCNSQERRSMVEVLFVNRFIMPLRTLVDFLLNLPPEVARLIGAFMQGTMGEDLIYIDGRVNKRLFDHLSLGNKTLLVDFLFTNSVSFLGERWKAWMKLAEEDLRFASLVRPAAARAMLQLPHHFVHRLFQLRPLPSCILYNTFLTSKLLDIFANYYPDDYRSLLKQIVELFYDPVRPTRTELFTQRLVAMHKPVEQLFDLDLEYRWRRLQDHISREST